MQILDVLRSDLAVLTQALDDPGTDLQAVLEVLTDDLTDAVPSFLGLTMTLHLQGVPVSFTTTPHEHAVRASMLLPLTAPMLTSGSGPNVVLYAATPNAFTDLAVDLRWCGQPGVCLDQHLSKAGDSAGETGIVGLAELAEINQALGILLEQGLLPEEAPVELARLACCAHSSIPEAARHVTKSFPDRCTHPDNLFDHHSEQVPQHP